jgi:hypothetical protein
MTPWAPSGVTLFTAPFRRGQAWGAQINRRRVDEHVSRSNCAILADRSASTVSDEREHVMGSPGGCRSPRWVYKALESARFVAASLYFLRSQSDRNLNPNTSTSSPRSSFNPLLFLCFFLAVSRCFLLPHHLRRTAFDDTERDCRPSFIDPFMNRWLTWTPRDSPPTTFPFRPLSSA